MIHSHCPSILHWISLSVTTVFKINLFINIYFETIYFGVRKNPSRIKLIFWTNIYKYLLNHSFNIYLEDLRVFVFASLGEMSCKTDKKRKVRAVMCLIF